MRRGIGRCLHAARLFVYDIQHPINVQRPCIGLKVNVDIATSDLGSHYIHSLFYLGVPFSLSQRFTRCYTHNILRSIVSRQTILNAQWFVNVHQKPQLPQGKSATP